MNSWPKGYRHAMSQSEHHAWNSANYPGTRQLCSICGGETGRCEDDEILCPETEEPICLSCYKKLQEAGEDAK